MGVRRPRIPNEHDFVTTRTVDVWASGDAYEPYIGRWSRLVAREFLRWVGAPPGSRWLDVGCGTGALAEAIVRDAAPASVEAVDPSPAYIAHARRRLDRKSVV